MSTAAVHSRRDPFTTAERNVVSVFTEKELRYLHGERRLGRLATVGQDGMPHVAPVGWAYNTEHETIDIGGHSLDWNGPRSTAMS